MSFVNDAAMDKVEHDLSLTRAQLERTSDALAEALRENERLREQLAAAQSILRRDEETMARQVNEYIALREELATSRRHEGETMARVTRLRAALEEIRAHPGGETHCPPGKKWCGDDRCPRCIAADALATDKDRLTVPNVRFAAPGEMPEYEPGPEGCQYPCCKPVEIGAGWRHSTRCGGDARADARPLTSLAQRNDGDPGDECHREAGP